MNFGRILPMWFFRWCQDSALGQMIQHSRWAFATIETLHIMALAVLLGTFVIVDLRLLGKGLRQDAVADLAGQFGPWSWLSLGVMIATGIPMYVSEAIRLANSSPFFYKMMFLVLAVGFHLTIHRKASGSAEAPTPGLAKLAASLSLACWLAVALAGRAIAFLSK